MGKAPWRRQDKEAAKRLAAAQLAEAAARDVEDRAKLHAEQTEQRREEATDLDGVLDTKATALEDRLEKEIENRYHALATWLHEQAEWSLRDAQAQLAEHAAALERAGAERAEEAETRLAEGRDRLEQLAGELEARIAAVDREAGSASAEAERRVHQQAERLHSEAEQALARVDALAEQVAKLLSTLEARDVRASPKRGALPRADQHPSARGAPIDANEATLDDLRGLSLSLTQATRMLKYREALGGFTSWDQLDDVPGISDELRTGLREALTIHAEGDLTESRHRARRPR